MQGTISFVDIKKWHDEGEKLEQELINYDWEYRKKICSKCSIEEQQNFMS